ncbi:histone acetyltransferase type B catalytic subunit [Plectosphaerella plurivora]|uniref:Histone acetyltransferase type B catalytic subunit n=1 Tax=Plectosphaerella plurivora TaxID=936078 RepID=A0A9P9A7M8_9PEZI|nr:histone acetyltransferase type B catalytic subunit [Plectosphaerella plurivora]
MADQEEWSENATEATTISLVRPGDGGKTIASFNPKFTYPIFGEEERIFGYKGLKINLRFHAHDMRPNVTVTSKNKFKAVGETEPADITALLQGHLPPVAFLGASTFDSASPNPDWTPPGDVHDTFSSSDATYEIRRGNLADKSIGQLMNRIEIFSLLFIEGGSYIGREQEGPEPFKTPDDAAQWTVYFLYRKQPSAADATKSEYTFVGYSTVRRFFYFQPPTPPTSPKSDWDLPKAELDIAELPCRSRISQFIILPPFQGKGIGARLYNSIFKYYIETAQTKEIPVEDPNEEFDDMRDLADLTYLRTIPDFAKVRLNLDLKLPKDYTSAVPRDIVDPALLDKLRAQTKIVPRQFARLIEMHTMSQLPETVQPTFAEKKPSPTAADKHQYHLWQLFVKRRIYRQNRDVLGQLDSSERLDKLNEALGSVELEYCRLLASHVQWAKHYETGDSASKRKLDDEAEDAGSAKKARV